MKILFLEEKQSEIKLYEGILEDAMVTFESRVAKTENEFIKQVNHFHPDLILSGYTLSKYSINEALKYLKEQSFLIPFIFITGSISEEIARAYIEKGVDDYVPKSNLFHLPVVIKNVMRKKAAEKTSHEAELSRKISEGKLQIIFDNNPDCMFEIGFRGELLKMNPAAKNLTEIISPDKLKKATIWNFVDKKYLKKFRSFHENVCRGNKKEFTFKFVSSKGTIHFIEATAVPIFNADKHVTSSLLIGRNITEKIKAEHELQISQSNFNEQLKTTEELFMNLSENAPIGIYKTDTNGNCTYVNKKWCQLTEFTFEDALGKGWIEALHPDDKARIFDQWYDTTKKNQLFHAEYRYLSRSGKEKWVSGNAVINKDANGEVTGYIGTVEDITEIKEKEMKIAEAEKNFYHIFNNSPDAIYIEDENGTILNANKEAGRFQGMPPEALIGINITELAPKEKTKEIMENYLMLWDQEISRLKSYTWNKNGTEIPIEIHSRRIIFNNQPALLLHVREILQKKIFKIVT